jgi:hypothetical protein
MAERERLPDRRGAEACTAASIAPQTIAGALDYGRFELIAELAETAASYWSSIALAAMRGEHLTVETHCRQVAALTREAFRTVKTLGESATAEPAP